jgi:hypothetical protein
MSSGNTTQSAAITRSNQSIESFAASLSTAAVIFGAQIAIFLILSGNWKLHKGIKKKNNNVGEATDKAVERQSLFHKI